MMPEEKLTCTPQPLWGHCPSCLKLAPSSPTNFTSTRTRTHAHPDSGRCSCHRCSLNPEGPSWDLARNDLALLPPPPPPLLSLSSLPSRLLPPGLLSFLGTDQATDLPVPAPGPWRLLLPNSERPSMKRQGKKVPPPQLPFAHPSVHIADGVAIRSRLS